MAKEILDESTLADVAGGANVKGTSFRVKVTYMNAGKACCEYTQWRTTVIDAMKDAFILTTKAADQGMTSIKTQMESK